MRTPSLSGHKACPLSAALHCPSPVPLSLSSPHCPSRPVQMPSALAAPRADSSSSALPPPPGSLLHSAEPQSLTACLPTSPVNELLISALGKHWRSILFPFGLVPGVSMLPSALLQPTRVFVLLPETKPPAPLPSRQLGFGPASQVAAGTQMKGPSEGCLWQSAQTRPGSPAPSCPTRPPSTVPI